MLRTRAAEGQLRVVVVPIGFVADHVEVLYDLAQADRPVEPRSGPPAPRAVS